MNPALLLTLNSLTKRQIYFVLETLLIVTALPMMAVFSLGSSALSLLLGSSSASASGIYEGPLSKTDTYAWGNCTYWASLLREQAKDPIPNTWGNANTWASRAKADGYVVDNNPTQNAIMQTTAGFEGHVAYVTAVDPITGSWTISEMNVKGLDIVDTQTLPAKAALSFSFIHDKVVP